MNLGELLLEAEKLLSSKRDKKWLIEYEKWLAEIWKLKQIKGNDS